MEHIQVGPIKLYVRPGTWDADIAREVVVGDCYRYGGWNPTNQVTVVDVGAHIGSFSRWTARKAPQARIFSLEMDPSNVEVCKANLSDLPNVTLLPVALGNRSGPVVRGPAQPIVTGGGHVSWDQPVSDAPTVDGLAVRDFLRQHGVTYIDCLKLDCEGSEYVIIDQLSQQRGGLRALVGCIRAELHDAVTAPRHQLLYNQIMDAFPFVELVPTSSPSQHFLYAWR